MRERCTSGTALPKHTVPHALALPKHTVPLPMPQYTVPQALLFVSALCLRHPWRLHWPLVPAQNKSNCPWPQPEPNPLASGTAQILGHESGRGTPLQPDLMDPGGSGEVQPQTFTSQHQGGSPST